jgi:hypothetical protein
MAATPGSALGRYADQIYDSVVCADGRCVLVVADVCGAEPVRGGGSVDGDNVWTVGWGRRAAAPSDYIICPSPSCQEQPLLSEGVLHTTPIRQHFPLQSATQFIRAVLIFPRRAGLCTAR